MSLTDKQIERIEKMVQASIEKSIEEQLGSYKVAKEQHYQDHLWLSEWREWQENIRSTFWRSVVKYGMGVIFSLLLLGFIFWGKAHFK